jgi:hypothetical protein
MSHGVSLFLGYFFIRCINMLFQYDLILLKLICYKRENELTCQIVLQISFSTLRNMKISHSMKRTSAFDSSDSLRWSNQNIAK